jgi:hypothetical protein
VGRTFAAGHDASGCQDRLSYWYRGSSLFPLQSFPNFHAQREFQYFQPAFRARDFASPQANLPCGAGFKRKKNSFRRGISCLSRSFRTAKIVL